MGKIRRSPAVVGVMALVLLLRVVKHVEELDDFDFGGGYSGQP